MRFPNQGREMPPAPLPPGEPQDPVSLLAAQLPTATPDQQRMLLGEALYPLVDAVEPASSAKITGMLLEMDNGELLHLLESPEALSSKIKEAIQVLEAHAQSAAE